MAFRFLQPPSPTALRVLQAAAKCPTDDVAWPVVRDGLLQPTPTDPGCYTLSRLGASYLSYHDPAQTPDKAAAPCRRRVPRGPPASLMHQRGP